MFVAPDPDPQPAAIRLLKRLNAAMGVDALRTDTCRLFPKIESEMLSEMDSALSKRDYSRVSTLAGELELWSRMRLELCPK